MASRALHWLRAFEAREPRSFWLFLAFCLIWAQAGYIQQFFTGFFDGVASAAPHAMQ